MTTRREYAISLGLAKPGKGRMSREANEAIAKAEANGTVFETPVVGNPRPNKKIVTQSKSATERANDERERKAQRTAEESPDLLSKPFTGKFEAVMPNGRRKPLSDRTACQCGASLCYCRCKVPTVGLLIVDPGADDVEGVVQIARV